MLLRFPRGARILVAAAALFVCPPGSANGQEYRSTLTGLVSDAQGLALPGVTVTATHVETGTAHQAVTEGEWRLHVRAASAR